MKNFLIIFLFLSCTKEHKQVQHRGVCGGKACPASYIILFSGESNAGGKGLNSDATSHELSIRQSVYILNNNTLFFQHLQLGVNNLLGYNGATEVKTTVHGWELGLANSVDSSNIKRPVYLVKTGLGGSRAKDWSIGNVTGYWDTLTKRTDRAVSIVTTLNRGEIPKVYMWYSLGINDAGWGTNTENWKVLVKQIFANVRARYGSVPVFMTYIPDRFPTFNIAITEICNEIQDCYPIETRDLPVFPDHIHWTYPALKIIAQRVITSMKANYNL